MCYNKKQLINIKRLKNVTKNGIIIKAKKVVII